MDAAKVAELKKVSIARNNRASIDCDLVVVFIMFSPYCGCNSQTHDDVYESL